MILFNENPVEFQEFLTQKGLITDIYNAVKRSDDAESVTTALDILTKTRTFPPFKKQKKNDNMCDLFCTVGERLTVQGRYGEALESYNKALLFAPKDSESMMLSYWGRSRLLLICKAYSACLKDIETVETCLKRRNISCPANVQAKLQASKQICQNSLHLEIFLSIKSDFTRNFFKFDVQKNSNISCVSADVDILTDENGLPKPIAGKDIAVGTVVALEKAFVSHLDDENRFRACHYCHKLSLTLIPCDNCSEYLFCDNLCKTSCMKEYHDVECKIIDNDYRFTSSSSDSLVLKAALKFRNMCMSWDEFISLTSNIGQKKEYSVNEYFDSTNKQSILSCKDNTHFLYGGKYNRSFYVATFIKYLEEAQTFFPDNVSKKQEAIKAMGRLMMYLYTVINNRIDISTTALNYSNMSVTNEPEPNVGYFCFTSKLKHSCNANVQVVGLNNRVALIAIRPIRKGEELQVSYLGHWYEEIHEHRIRRLFTRFRITCRCQVCLEKWTPKTVKKGNMNQKQKTCLRKWRSSCDLIALPYTEEKHYKITCDALGVFADLANTEEHYNIFRKWRQLLMQLQNYSTDNVILQ